MATGNANIVAVMGKKDNAGACPVGRGKAVEGYGTRAGVAPVRSLDVTSCELDSVTAEGERYGIFRAPEGRAEVCTVVGARHAVPLHRKP